MTRSVDIRLRNNLAEIGAARDTLESLGSEFGVPMRPLMQLQVALDEIVSNVVKYSWSDGAEHEFLVRITIHAGSVDLEIFDDGQAFNPLSAPAPNPPPDGERPRPGGLGIHMVKKLLDDFSYERIDGRNHTTLRKKFDVGAAIQGSEK